MRRFRCALHAGAIVAGLASWSVAEPNWTKTGDCMSCHSMVLPGIVKVQGFYTRANPNNHGRAKVIWAKPGETKPLIATVSKLAPGDHYGAAITRFSTAGVQYGRLLSYGADCDWAQWWSASAGFFSDPPRRYDSASHYVAPAGPTLFQYDVYISPTCPTDYYELAYVIAGAPSEGNAVFYGDEHFYLYVSSTAPPIVKVADFDCDGDVDLGDFAVFQTCFNGPNRAPAQSTCSDADFDEDGDVDLSDFATFQTCFNGPNQAPATACPN